MRNFFCWVVAISLVGLTEAFALPQSADQVQGSSPEECYQAGVKYAEERNLIAAEKWLKLAAEKGHAAAQHRLGLIYFVQNPEIPKNSAEAVKWFGKSAEQGYVPALCHLAWAYLSGDGVGRDTEKAIDLLKRSAEGGFAEAMFALGNLFLEGRAVPQDKQKAFEWFEQSALRGHTGAQYNVGAMLWMGDGVDKNPVRAYAWVSVSAASGDPGSQKYKALLSKRLNADQIADALMGVAELNRQIRAFQTGKQE